MKSKEGLEVAKLVLPISLKLGHRLVRFHFSAKSGKLTAHCKRCKWKLLLCNKTMLFANSSYLTKISGEPDAPRSEKINHELFLANLCPKVSSML